MPSLDVSLANSALRLLGEFALVSLDEGTDLAQTVQQLMPDSITALLADHPWRFTMAKQQMARLLDPPVAEWTRAHALPSDLLSLRAVFPDAAADLPIKDWELFPGAVYSNRDQLWAEYQKDAPSGAWPPYFRNLARHAIATDIALAIGAGVSKRDAMERTTYGTPQEGRNGGLMGRAKRLDSMQQPARRIMDFPLLAARRGAS